MEELSKDWETRRGVFPRIGQSRPNLFQGLENHGKIFPEKYCTIIPKDDNHSGVEGW
jgi:hypothetical protein